MRACDALLRVSPTAKTEPRLGNDWDAAAKYGLTLRMDDERHGRGTREVGPHFRNVVGKVGAG